jgi:tetratricopeptide (TPR) repeat protein
VDEALELQPELPEGHLALAWYHYWGHQDYEQALEEVTIVERGLPNDVRVLVLTGAIWRRQGKFEAAIDGFHRAFALSPQDARIAYNIGDTYRALRRYAEADRYYDLSISLAPDQQYAYGGKAYNYISWLGDTTRARDVLGKMPGKRRDVQEWSLELRRLERNYEAILDFAPSESRPITWRVIWGRHSSFKSL